MPQRPPFHHHFGHRTEAQRNRAHDAQRGSSRQRGYTSQWERARKVFLDANPLCVMCERENTISPATIVDHIRPHRGYWQLFWDKTNWQPLCKRHHNREKQREERGPVREDVTKLFPIPPRL